MVDHGVTFGRAPTRDVALPRLEGVPTRSPSLIDRVSDQCNDRWGLVAAGAGIGAGTTALLAARSGRGVAGRIGMGALGALGGAALLIGGGVLLDTLRRRGTESVSTAAAAGAHVAGTDTKADEHLRVMSFNIHGSLGPGGELVGNAADLERVARVIEREHPDVVLLQEVDDHAIQSGFRDVLGTLADRLDADGAVHAASARTVTGRRNGTAVLTFNGVQVADARGIVSPDAFGEGNLHRIASAVDTAANFVADTVADREWHPFGAPMYRPRTTTDVMVTTPAGTAVRVLSGHWSWPSDGVEHPRRQVDPLAGLLGAWEGPTLVGGDFNVRSGTPLGDKEAAAFGASGLVDAFTATGIATDDPVRRTFGGVVPSATGAIDRIYASDDLEVTDVRVGTHVVDGIEASDHHPLVVDYRLTASDDD
jgi:endonuclease/exonuclease/phosphatase family metal-dependent hydrolase